jgi:hypothetical protein
MLRLLCSLPLNLRLKFLYLFPNFFISQASAQFNLSAYDRRL